MLWWQNIPFFSIILFLLSAAVCSVLPPRGARAWARAVLGLCLAGGALLLAILGQPGSASFTFMMGHFPAPWGNEIRAGALEALLACLFPGVMLCALLSGAPALSSGRQASREPQYLSLCMLLMAALLSQAYSNDLFTCYVFLEIMTLSAGALIVFQNSGRALAAGMRYMVLNLVGSGLFLLGVVLLYDLTGHLLMENLFVSLQALAATGEYHRSLTIIIALITVGLSIKSALFPFHSWAPDAYSSSVPSSNAILSSLVSKGYILLLLKVYARVFGWDLVLLSQVDHLLLVFAWAGMIFGSLAAIRTSRFTRMIAWSSVAQIGYIFLGVGLGAGGGYQAAVFHLLVHSCSKALLFLSGEELRRSAGGSDSFADLAGAARKHPVYGALWTVGAFSLVGLPFTGGLISKLLLGGEALRHSPPVAIITLAVLALSTLLNVLYFLRTMLILWSPDQGSSRRGSLSPLGLGACGLLAAGILVSFFLAQPLLEVISLGLSQFS
ncbi:MAG: sodium:proton antiporter [Clostridia bacterium]|nr:sodium:proton antiporter [Clostridia bacterium]